MRDLRDIIIEVAATHYGVAADLLRFSRTGKRGIGNERELATKARRMMLALAYHHMPTSTQREIAKAMGSSNPTKVREAVRAVTFDPIQTEVLDVLKDRVTTRLFEKT